MDKKEFIEKLADTIAMVIRADGTDVAHSAFEEMLDDLPNEAECEELSKVKRDIVDAVVEHPNVVAAMRHVTDKALDYILDTE